MKYKLRVLSMHEMGQRTNQEDYMYPAPGMATDNDRCFVLCDGMGGHDSGEVASQAVCNAMGNYVKEHSSPDDVFTPEQLADAVSAAYDALDARDTHAVKKMGTTMTFACFNAGGCLVAHMGDSRVYHLRPSMGILFETRDHSLVNDLIKVGELTEETAKDFGQKNVITRCLQPNTERRSRADVREITDIRPGDYFFMCSDGVNEVMESKHIENVILDKTYSDEEKLQIIINSTVEARDNHTAFLIHVLDVSGAVPVTPVQYSNVEPVRQQASFTPAAPLQQEPPKKSMSGFYIGVAVAAVLLSGVIGYFLAGGGDDDSKSPRKENVSAARDLVEDVVSSTTSRPNATLEEYIDDETANYPVPKQFGDKYVFMDKNSNDVFHKKFDYAERFSACGLALVKIGDKYGYIDINGETVIECVYDQAGSFVNDRAIVERDGNVYIIDVDGKETPEGAAEGAAEPDASTLQSIANGVSASALQGAIANPADGEIPVEGHSADKPVKPNEQGAGQGGQPQNSTTSALTNYLNGDRTQASEIMEQQNAQDRKEENSVNTTNNANATNRVDETGTIRTATGGTGVVGENGVSTTGAGGN